MEAFRNLAKNIFFKIFLGILALSFVIFGVSGFILGGGGNWVASINGKKISYNQFLRALQIDRDLISRSNQSPEVLKYLDSEQFKNDVLNRLVTRNVVHSLQDDLGVYPSSDMILKQIATSGEFKDEQGKFDRTRFVAFLRSNGLNEEQYIDMVKDELTGIMVIGSLVETLTTNKKLAKEFYDYREEKRYVDLVTITTKNIGSIAKPNEFELTDFFEKNKAAFVLPEMRNASYLYFDRKILNEGINVTEEEVAKEYENNKSNYQIPESRNLYHLLFTDKKAAEEFLAALKNEAKKEKLDAAFVKLALQKEKKDKKAITFNSTKKDLLKEISDKIFALKAGEVSGVLESPMGFHVVYVNSVKPASNESFATVKDKIKKELLAKKQENFATEKLSAIEDELLSSNSLSKTAGKFKLKTASLPEFDVNGQTTKKTKVALDVSLEGFFEKVFASKKGQVSKLYYSEKNGIYYAILVDNVRESRQRSLDEVEVLATDMYIKSKQQEKLQELANTVSEEITKNKGNPEAVVAKYHLKLDRNREFPRFFLIDIGGRKLPYATSMMNEIFTLRIAGVSKAYEAEGDYKVAILRKIVAPSADEKKVQIYKEEMTKRYRDEILMEYNRYIQNKFNVVINQKLLQQNSKKDQ